MGVLCSANQISIIARGPGLRAVCGRKIDGFGGDHAPQRVRKTLRKTRRGEDSGL